MFALLLRDLPFSISAVESDSSHFYGMAVPNGVVLMSQVEISEARTDLPVLDVLRQACWPEAAPGADDGARGLSWLLLPMALAHGFQVEVQRPLATTLSSAAPITCTLPPSSFCHPSTACSAAGRLPVRRTANGNS